MKNTRMITEGAMLLALFILLLLAAMYIPILTIVLQIFLILPFLIYSAKHPLKYAGVFFVAALLVTIGTGQIVAIPFVLLYGLPGVFVGYGIRTKKDQVSLYISTSVLLTVMLVLLFMLASQIFDLNLLEELNNTFADTSAQYMELFKTLGQEPPAGLEEQLNNMMSTISTILVSILIMTSFIFTWVLFIVNFPILRRLGIEAPKFGPFRNFNLPKVVLWVYLAIVLVSLMANPEEGSYLYLVVINGLYILQMLLVIQGLAFVFYLCHARKLPKVLPIVLTVFTFILPILPIVRMLGIIDVGFGLRKRLNQK